MIQEAFKGHIDKFAKVSNEEFAEILQYFDVQRLAKKENLLSEGQTCKTHYFVVKGILRKFFINKKGVEHTTEFAIENWWIADNLSIINQAPTEFYIEAVERSIVLSIHTDAYSELLEKHPVMEKYFRCVYLKTSAAAQMRIKFLYEHSREELYHHFRRSNPEFLQRVPQFLIASYLGFTPEYLSEIRKKGTS